ncbi:hypothetical protein EV178_004642 [Coemansia sp. RSA 1646]|nr:hypothetical protein EV178_004642 [Coemansia sp. RSA 1646]KAJ2213077.1 hypothetical protein EV179_004138 [Coemansia sp. RSA 487]
MVVASGVAFSLSFNTIVDRYWDRKTAGLKWEDIKDRYTTPNSQNTMIHSVFIINRSGGLIYNKNYNTHIAQLSSNEALIFAGTFHGIHALASRIAPTGKTLGTKDTGIQTIDTRNFRLHCFQTPTGIKFIAATDLLHANLTGVLTKIYELYCDYALKSPFYNLEMPVRSDMFDANMLQLVQQN